VPTHEADPPITGEARRYHITSLLGQGGFGTVYRARLEGSEGFHKDVAIKILRDKEPPSEVLSRFRDEARILGLVRDPHVVSVDPPVRLEGRWAIVMEYVDGTSCEELLRQRVFPPSVALQVVEVVARTLDHLWNASDAAGRKLELVHRDLKPSNIQITPNGHVKLLDFGVARAEFDAREARTELEIGGTPGYIAPERLEGDESQKGDVYSLGVVLHRLITGVRPSPAPLPPDILANDDAMVALALSAEMRHPDPTSRPTPREVAERCRELQAEVMRIDLARWAAEHVSATPNRAPDELVGKWLSETMSILRPRRREEPVTRKRSLFALALLIVLVSFLVTLLSGGVIIAVALWTRAHPSGPADVAVVEVPPAPADDDPEVEPVPTEPVRSAPTRPTKPRPPKPSSGPTGKVAVEGEASSVVLTCAGATYPPGTVPAGTCDVTATFAEGPVPAGQVTVPEGGRVTLTCLAAFQRCRAR
jgi:serine/threonine protein kinase